MVRQRRTTGRRGRLERAAERYRERFGADALPCLFCVSDQSVPVAAAMLDYAVAIRRPLRHGQIALALGESEPPFGIAI